MKKIVLLVALLSVSLFAESVYTKTYTAPASEVYAKLIKALDEAHLIVVSEIDILAKFKAAGLPKKLGKEFNTNNLTAIKAIIACNGKFGNSIANSDPQMMAFCPVRITVVEKEGKTSVLYVRPTSGTQESKAHASLEALEKKVISTIGSL